MILPDSLYFFSKKLVEVERTPSMVESFAETNEATSWSESPLHREQQIEAPGDQIEVGHFRETGNPSRHLVEAAFAPRSQPGPRSAP